MKSPRSSLTPGDQPASPPDPGTGPVPWVHVFRGNQVTLIRPLERPETTLGSLALCDICLKAPGVPHEFGRLLLDSGGSVTLQPAAGRARQLRSGERFDIGPFTVVLEVRDGPARAGGVLLPLVLDLAPRLWSAESDDEVFRLLLEALLPAFRSQWGAILTLDPGTGSPRVIQHSGHRPARSDTGVSQSIVEQVLSRRRPVLVADVREDPALSTARSIPVMIHSVIAAPILQSSDVAGIMYLESSHLGQAFTDEQRDLLGQICTFASEHIEKARKNRELARTNERLIRSRPEGEGDLGSLVGASKAMASVIEQIHQVAATDVTTLIVGETGTGKELVARAIHSLSGRGSAPYVSVNCMALPEDLVEGELFGHMRGAFSGATADRIGRFELASGGTLFLDEIGELSLSVQVKLLRVLQERVVQRLGESRERRIDVRLIAATNADLPSLVARGLFREDLFYRVTVFKIDLPPLRERGEDLSLLVDHFVRQFNRSLGRRIRGVAPEAMQVLRRHPWPGNVRELRNVLEQAFVREKADQIGIGSLSILSTKVATGPGDEGLPEELESAKMVFEKRRILRALELSHGQVQKAAQRLGVTRGCLYKKLALHQIDSTRYRS